MNLIATLFYAFPMLIVPAVVAKILFRFIPRVLGPWMLFMVGCYFSVLFSLIPNEEILKMTFSLESKVIFAASFAGTMAGLFTIAKDFKPNKIEPQEDDTQEEETTDRIGIQK